MASNDDAALRTLVSGRASLVEQDDTMLNALVSDRVLAAKHGGANIHNFEGDDAALGTLVGSHNRPARKAKQLLTKCLLAALGHPDAATVLPDKTAASVPQASQWAFVGPRDVWCSVGLNAEVFQALEQQQLSLDVDVANQELSLLAAAAVDTASHWNEGREALQLERFVRHGGTAVAAVSSKALGQWRATGIVRAGHFRAAAQRVDVRGGSLDASTTTGSRKCFRLRLDSHALRNHLGTVLAEDLVLRDDVALAGGQMLKRGWQIMSSTGGPCNRLHLRRLLLPATLLFDTQPGLPVLHAPGSLQPGLAELTRALADAEVEVPIRLWPPKAGTRVRHRAAGSAALVSMAVAGDLGTMLGPKTAVAANGEGCASLCEGWVIVKWDHGGTEPQHVDDLQVADDTTDFVKRVVKFHGNSVAATSPKLEAVPEFAEEAQEASQWHFLVVCGVDSSCGSLIIWDPEPPKAGIPARPLMPTATLQRCIDAVGSVPTALLICREGSNALHPPAPGWLRVGDRVLVEPAALRAAGANGCEPGDSWYRHQALKPPWVPAHVAAMTGNGAVGVLLDHGMNIKPGTRHSVTPFRSCRGRSRSQPVVHPRFQAVAKSLHQSCQDTSDAIHWVHAERLRPSTKVGGNLY